ncbi:MAG: hypothetical protein IJ089_04535 [Clostridia bacterium]|nr:hypothetical protein [Clostridia bacterium]
MESLRADFRAFSAWSTRRKAVAIGALALILALAVGLIVSINMRANIQREYTAARNRAGQQLYDNLFILMQTFDSTAVPNIDVRNAILPQMRDYYVASITLNNLLAATYGPKYAVLTDSDINSLTSAFTSYEAAYQNNTSTDLARSDMQLCMDRVKELLNTRYSQGVLKAGR